MTCGNWPHKDSYQFDLRERAGSYVYNSSTMMIRSTYYPCFNYRHFAIFPYTFIVTIRYFILFVHSLLLVLLAFRSVCRFLGHFMSTADNRLPFTYGFFFGISF